MAQPLKLSIQPFCLGVYGTDNRFNHAHVTARWSYIQKECHERGIFVLTESGDGDSRIMKASRIKAGLRTNLSPDEMDWFKVILELVSIHK